MKEVHLKYPPRPPVIVWSSYPCSKRETRALMSNDEYWEDVALSLGFSVIPDDCDYDGEGPGLDITLSLVTEPCEVCGANGACGYDSEGRPMIHATQGEDES